MFLVLLSVLAFSFTALSSGSSSESWPEAPTSAGPVRGQWEKSFSGRKVAAFRGIPYAQPPVGERRFMPPEPASSWSSVLSATRDGAACPQLTPGLAVVGEEDCLWLSVFKPEVTQDNKKNSLLLPVAVWIHGGRFLTGTAASSLYSPEYLLDEDVVVVAVQYRLGALGFLSTEDELAPGNYGLLDQTLALEWVRDNVRNFGGDPDRVTLVGHSAGAACVHAHVASSRSRGLFRHVAALSGSAVNIWAARYIFHREVAHKQAEILGCPTEDSQQLLSCLRGVPVADLVSSMPKLHSLMVGKPAQLPITMYTPRIDKEAKEPFMPKSPRDALADGDFTADVPLLLGVTSEEGSWYTADIFSPGNVDERLGEINRNVTGFLELLCGFRSFGLEDLARLRSFYFGSATELSASHLKAATHLVSDVVFNAEVLQAAHLHAVHAHAPVYFYRFDFRGEWSMAHVYDTVNDYDGVAHVDDIRYLLRLPWAPDLKTSSELLVMQKWTAYLVNFVRSGSPTPATGAWKPWTATGANVMEVGADGSTIVRQRLPFPEDRILLWERTFGSKESVVADFDRSSARTEL